MEKLKTSRSGRLESYKRKDHGVGVDKRTLRAHGRQIARQNLRDEIRNRHRKMDLHPLQEIDNNEGKKKNNKGLTRKEMLEKWKEERELKRKLEAKTKPSKPTFKVSIVHHPVSDVKTTCASKNKKEKVAAKTASKPAAAPPPARRVTRSTANANKLVMADKEQKNGKKADVKTKPQRSQPERRVTRGSVKAAAVKQNQKVLPKKKNNKDKEISAKTAQQSEENTDSSSGNENDNPTSTDSDSSSVDYHAIDSKFILDRPKASTSSVSSFAPDNFTFTAPSDVSSFVFKPLSPESAASFLFPSQEGGSYLSSPAKRMAFVCQSPMIEIARRTPKLKSPEILEQVPPMPDLSEFDENCPPKDLDSELQAADHQVATTSTASVNEAMVSKEESGPTGENVVTSTTNIDSALTEPINQSTPALLSANPSGEHDVPYFRNLLASETARLNTLCEQWENIGNDVSENEEVSGQIRTTIGQAQLLMRQRFKQFEGLVDKCENKSGEKAIHCSDLQGFWDMVYFQVEDVDAKFVDLAKRQASNWVSEKPKIEKKKIIKKKPAGTKAAKPAVKSKFAEFRAQMKAQKAAQTETSEVKTFDAGFFKVNSPVKSPALSSATPGKVVATEEQKNKPPLASHNTGSPSLKVPTTPGLTNLQTPGGRRLSRRNTPVVPSPLLKDCTPGMKTRRRSLRNASGDLVTPSQSNKLNRSCHTPFHDAPSIFTPDSLDRTADRQNNTTQESALTPGVITKSKTPKSTSKVTFLTEVPEVETSEDNDMSKFLQPSTSALSDMQNDSLEKYLIPSTSHNLSITQEEENMEVDPQVHEEEMPAQMKRALTSEFDEHSRSAEKRSVKRHKSSQPPRTPRSSRRPTRRSSRRSVHFSGSYSPAHSTNVLVTPYSKNSLVPRARVLSGSHHNTLSSPPDIQPLLTTPPPKAEAGKAKTPESASPATRFSNLRVDYTPGPIQQPKKTPDLLFTPFERVKTPKRPVSTDFDEPTVNLMCFSPLMSNQGNKENTASPVLGSKLSMSGKQERNSLMSPLRRSKRLSSVTQPMNSLFENDQSLL